MPERPPPSVRTFHRRRSDSISEEARRPASLRGVRDGIGRKLPVEIVGGLGRSRGHRDDRGGCHHPEQGLLGERIGLRRLDLGDRGGSGFASQLGLKRSERRSASSVLRGLEAGFPSLSAMSRWSSYHSAPSACNARSQASTRSIPGRFGPRDRALRRPARPGLPWQPQPGPGVAPSSSVERPTLPPRTEVVARADALALEGTRLGGPPGASLVFEAAELRERLYRIERREVDALEAAELFGSVARTGGELCVPRARPPCARRSGAARRSERRLSSAIYAERARAKRVRVPRPGRSSAARPGRLRAARARCSPSSRHERASVEGADAAASASVADQADGRAFRASPRRPSAPSRNHQHRTLRRRGRRARRRSRDASGALRHELRRGERPISRRASFVDLPNVGYRGKKKLAVGGLVSACGSASSDSGTRIVLDLTGAGAPAGLLPAGAVSAGDRRFERAAAFARRRARAGRAACKRVVLDPGHGGHDPGATGPCGLREKDVTLDIAHRAAPLIARELGDLDAAHARRRRLRAARRAHGARQRVRRRSLDFDSLQRERRRRGHGVMTFVLDDSSDAPPRASRRARTRPRPRPRPSSPTR